MKKNVFKFGAALTAAMMVFSATASLAFADEVADVAEETTVVTEVAADVVEETEEAVEETEEAADVDADEETAPEVVDEVAVPMETEEITAADVEEEAEVFAAGKTDDVATGSKIAIGDITASKSGDYYTVSVPFTVSDGVPSQMSFFVYDITAITTGDQNNTVGFTSSTPVGYINQYAGAASGTYTFKLAATSYTDDSIIVVKMGGTDVATPDAKSFVLGSAQPGGETTLGDVNGDGKWNAEDTLLVLQYGAGKIELTDDQKVKSDVNHDGKYNAEDTLLILQYGAGKIDKLN